jgi:hypothetical protein
MNACRPTKPLGQCNSCARITLPIVRRDKARRWMPEIVIDPTAILPRDRLCPFYAPNESVQALTLADCYQEAA